MSIFSALRAIGPLNIFLFKNYRAEFTAGILEIGAIEMEFQKRGTVTVE
jgi:hypothetical protein